MNSSEASSADTEVSGIVLACLASTGRSRGRVWKSHLQASVSDLPQSSRHVTVYTRDENRE